MKAAALTGSRAIAIVEIPDGPPAAGDVKLRVAYCGICGSDLHEYESANPFRALGLLQPVMGHEFSGRVVEVGEGVTSVRAGQLVVGNPGPGCGACPYCVAGRENLCRAGSVGGTGYTRAGAYAEYVTVPERAIVALPDAADLQSCALTEPFAVARHALIQARYRPEELLVVAGAGPIGLLTVIAARQLGATRVVVSEPLAGRRAAAAEAGASHTVEPGQLIEVSRNLSDGEGAPVAVDASGHPAGIASCVDAAARGGRVVLAGVGEQPFPLDITRSIINELSYLAVLGYTRAEFADSARLIASGEVDVASVISETVAVEATPHAFARLSEGRDALRKILVSPDV
ncbi:MAG TPA: alcohol dehydrogenase catalytic domain-containing protein [Dehalococcoidia bacterium]|nr:alcohol dehydrogenase catalytic domain-containing protein [Dehalococcoidia bacterium]